MPPHAIKVMINIEFTTFTQYAQSPKYTLTSIKARAKALFLFWLSLDYKQPPFS